MLPALLYDIRNSIRVTQDARFRDVFPTAGEFYRKGAEDSSGRWTRDENAPVVRVQDAESIEVQE